MGSRKELYAPLTFNPANCIKALKDDSMVSHTVILTAISHQVWVSQCLLQTSWRKPLNIDGLLSVGRCQTDRVVPLINQKQLQFLIRARILNKCHFCRIFFFFFLWYSAVVAGQWLPSLRHIRDICLQLVSLLFRIPGICCSSAVVSFSLSYVSQSSCLLKHLAITHHVGEHAQAIGVFVDLSCWWYSDSPWLDSELLTAEVADFCCPADLLHLSPYPHFKSFYPFHIWCILQWQNIEQTAVYIIYVKKTAQFIQTL